MSNNLEQKYYEGFIKAAVENGLSFPQAIGLFKQAVVGGPAGAGLFAKAPRFFGGAGGIGEDLASAASAAEHNPMAMTPHPTAGQMPSTIMDAMGGGGAVAKQPGMIEKFLEALRPSHAAAAGAGAAGGLGIGALLNHHAPVPPPDPDPAAQGMPDWAKYLAGAGAGLGAGGLGAAALMGGEHPHEEKHHELAMA